jgi:formamidopyrimidine-DNA glycosylase
VSFTVDSVSVFTRCPQLGTSHPLAARRASLSADEVERLYNCMRTVLSKAIETLRDWVGDKIDVEVRDFLAVHGREGEDCPRRGGRISEITYERISTHFCRACQPGLMVAKGRKL